MGAAVAFEPEAERRLAIPDDNQNAGDGDDGPEQKRIRPERRGRQNDEAAKNHQSQSLGINVELRVARGAFTRNIVIRNVIKLKRLTLKE